MVCPVCEFIIKFLWQVTQPLHSRARLRDERLFLGPTVYIHWRLLTLLRRQVKGKKYIKTSIKCRIDSKDKVYPQQNLRISDTRAEIARSAKPQKRSRDANNANCTLSRKSSKCFSHPPFQFSIGRSSQETQFQVLEESLYLSACDAFVIAFVRPVAWGRKLYNISYEQKYH